MSAARVVVNVAAFQVAWLCAVGGAATGRPWLGPAAAAALVAGHAWSAIRPLHELTSLVLIGALGMAWDSLVVALGLIDYTGAGAWPGSAPYWIAALWIAFATTLNVSLRWLRSRLWLAAALGTVLGPLAYAVGDAWGALRLVDVRAALLAQAQALGWACLLPLTSWLAARYDGFAAPEPQHV